MRPIEFPEQSVVIAKDQPEYTPLPALGHKGVVISCWEMTDDERREFTETGKLYLGVCTWGQPLQPLMMSTNLEQIKTNIDAFNL